MEIWKVLRRALWSQRILQVITVYVPCTFVAICTSLAAFNRWPRFRFLRLFRTMLTSGLTRQNEMSKAGKRHLGR